MDMLSFSVCLRRTFRRKQEEILTNTLNQRIAQSDAKCWKGWVKGMEKSMNKKALGPEAFESAFMAGRFNKGTRGRER